MIEQMTIPWPSDDSKEVEHLVELVNLRDKFAMAALTGLIASPMRHGEAEVYAVSAYRFADAMLAQRKKVQP